MCIGFLFKTEYIKTYHLIFNSVLIPIITGFLCCCHHNLANVKQSTSWLKGAECYLRFYISYEYARHLEVLRKRPWISLLNHISVLLSSTVRKMKASRHTTGYRRYRLESGSWVNGILENALGTSSLLEFP